MAAILPAYDAFAAGLARGENQLLYTRLAADLDTPVSLMLKLAGARPGAFVLESVTGGEVRGRYSIVGMKPDLIWRCFGERAEVNREARFAPDTFEPDGRAPLESLRALMAECRMALPEGLPAASAGLFGYLGYDMIRLVERLPEVNPDPLGLPDAVMMRPTVVAVLDGVKGEVTLCAPVWGCRGGEPPGRLRPGRGAGDGRGARPRPGAAGPAHARGSGRGGRAREQLHAGGLRGRRGPREGVHRRRRRLPGRAVAALARAPTPARPSRSTARCGAPTPRPSCSTST